MSRRRSEPPPRIKNTSRQGIDMMTQDFSRTLRAQLFGIALAIGVTLVSGCASTHSAVKTSETESEEPWIAPTPVLRQRIEDEAARMPWTHGIERVDLIHWFAKVGEPAYPTLLQMVLDPRPDVAGAALAALGATRDSRLVEHLRALPWPDDDQGSDLALERARTLLRLGDWRMMPRLIAGLSDERLMTRALCAQALEEATHERFDFDPRADAEQRAASIAKWEAWWQARNTDPLLTEPPKEPVARRADSE